MIIIKLQGGLGNQLFQWAFGLSLANKSNAELKFDTESYVTDKLRSLEISTLVDGIAIAKKNEIKKIRLENNTLNLLKRKIETLFNPYFKRTIICENTYLYDVRLDSQNYTSNYFEGYWQNEKYFINNRKQILNKINFKINNSKSYNQYKLQITETDSTAIAIHVRRGDYINDRRILEIHGICSLDYYKTSVRLMNEKYNNIHFYIFSNDLNWCEKKFSFIKNKTYVKNTETVFEDLELMSLCKGQIIANSSLSWWSAWINQNPNKKVIAPKKWFNKTTINYSELVPENWLKL